jgi:hypothetical protein
MPCSTPRMFTSIIRFHSSILSSASGESGMTPALLMITSILLNFFSANSTNACTSARLVTSSARYSAVPPAALISAVNFPNRSVRRAPSTTVCPLAAR